MASDPVASLIHTLSVELEEHKGLALENHLYGCLTIWEQWAEGSLEIKEGVVMEKGETPLDLQNVEEWATIGEAFGFTDSAPPYTGSEAYQAAWRSVFLNPVEWRSLGRVDAVEVSLFDRLEALGAVYMEAALATGTLPAEWVPPTESATEEEKAVETERKEIAAEVPRAARINGRRKYKHTRRTHGRRSLTPVQGIRHFSKTRRARRPSSF